MPAFGRATVLVGGGAMVAVPPSEPEPGPGTVFPTPATGHGARGTEWALAVCDFPQPTLRGVLWDAVFTYGRQTFGRGPATIDVEVPATPAALRTLGASTPYRDQAGRTLYRFDPLKIELAVTVDGRVTDRYVVRGDVQRQGGVLRFTGHTHDKLLHERVLGPAERKNSITNGSFDQGLGGWQTNGGATMTLHTSGGVDGPNWMSLEGPVGSYAYKYTRMVRRTEQEGRQSVLASVLVKVPDGDWDRYSAIQVNVRDRVTGRVWWPQSRRDGEFGLIDGSWRRNTFLADEVTARGWLPPAPFDAIVEARLMALGPGVSIGFDQTVVWRRGSNGTGYPRDLIWAPIALIRAQQLDPGKSTWRVNCVEGEPTGVVEQVQWWFGDKRSIVDCLSDVLEREDGPELWFDGSRRVFRSSARRGAVRTDIVIYPWDVLGGPGEWEQDSAAQKTQLHAVSSASSVFGGADVAVTDTSRTDGQVIEVVTQGPNGMTPNQLRQWARSRLTRLAIAPTTSSLELRWELGRRIAVGDQIRVVQTNGAEVSAVWMRVTAWRCDPQRRVVTVDFGNDPNEEG